MKKIKIETRERIDAIDITSKVKEVAKEVKDGIIFLYVPHTTAGIIINENWDPNILKDIQNKLKELIPERKGYLHDKVDGNADSHIKASIVGNEVFVFVENHSLKLGTWQAIIFLEFDGPREREVWVKVIES